MPSRLILQTKPAMIRIGLFAGLFLAATLHADWPQFRGPAGDGHSTSKLLPTAWSETKNVKWKTPIHGKGWSSPVILGNQIWVTTATEDGKSLSVLCLDLKDGSIIHDKKLFDVEKPQFCHKFNSYASSTPVIEAGRIYVTFGSPGTACLDTKTGSVLWERRDFVCNHYRGAGSSPIVHGDLLIMNYDGSDQQFMVALDKKTGRTVWRKERSIDYKDTKPDGKIEADGDWRKAYATPHVAMFGGKPLLISLGAKCLYGFNPTTGEELWRVEERGQHSAGTRPIVGHGTIYYPTGFSQGQLFAVKPDGKGDVTASHVLWKYKRASVPEKPSLLLIGDDIFMIDDGGVATCVEAKSGTEIWSERIGGNYSASPLHANGNIYFFSEEGKATVIKAGRKMEKVAESTLPDGFMASPAVTGKSLILRTRSTLYKIEE